MSNVKRRKRGLDYTLMGDMDDTGILLVCMYYVQSPCSVFYLVVIDKWMDATRDLGPSRSKV
jgi:hypothetical protein